MIVTKDFIIINFPKTGSTFVRETLKKLHHEPLWLKYWPYTTKKQYDFNIKQFPQIRTFNKRYNQPTEHGLFCQIPSQLRQDKTIVSIKRNIFDYYLSLYFYGDWKKKEALTHSLDEIKTHFPNFPDLTFDEFVQLNNKMPFYENNPKLKNVATIKQTLGMLSVQFVFFFFYQPFDFLNNLSRYDIRNLNYEELMPKVKFLDQRNLNTELYEFLLNYYPKRKIQFILTEKKKNVSNNKMSAESISDTTKNLILQNERLILNYFSEPYV